MRTPTLEPSLIGLTTKGRAIGSPRAMSARPITRLSASGRFAAAKTSFAVGLSIAIAEASTPECV